MKLADGDRYVKALKTLEFIGKAHETLENIASSGVCPHAYSKIT